MSDTLFDIAGHQEARDMYTILGEAEKRAAENGTDQAEEEGKLVEYHQRKIHQVLEYHKAERASRVAKIAYLREQLEAEEAALALIDSRIADETRHDLQVLASYIQQAPQYKNNRAGKTFPFAWGALQLRTKTIREGASVVDEQGLMERYPDYIGYKLRWGDLKKERLSIDESGRVMDKETGEVLPPELVAGTPRQSEEQAFVIVDGVKFDLFGGMEVGKEEDDGDSNDPFDAWE